MSRRYFFCLACQSRLGERTNRGLKAGDVTLKPRQSFWCEFCGFSHTNLTIAFAGADAKTNGLSSTQPTPKGVDLVSFAQKEVFDDMIQTIQALFSTGQLTVTKQGTGLFFDVKEQDSKVAEKAFSKLKDVVLDDRIPLEERRALLKAGLDALEPAAPPPEAIQEPVPTEASVAVAEKEPEQNHKGKKK